MNLLVVGGGIFVGRAVVNAARARGHQVAVFNRGQASTPPAGVDAIRGDRNRDLGVLRGRSWDAVIDTCGYFPRQVATLLAAVGAGISHYTFISTISVYRSFAAPGLTEKSPLAPPPAAGEETVTPQTYGPLKVACEAAAHAFPHTLLIRPGIIVGPGDATGRFTYWVRRAARGGEILAPESPESPLQLIDVRDLAEWTVAMVEQRAIGTFNAVGSPDLTWGEALRTSLQTAGKDGAATWVGGDFLVRHQLDDWATLPLAIPASNRGLAGIFRISGARAAAAGLCLRPLRDTTDALLVWSHLPQAAAAKQPGLDPGREAELLQAWKAGAA